MDNDKPTRPTPEPYTHAWYEWTFKGLHYQISRAMVVEADLHEVVTRLVRRVEELEKGRLADMAKIGELQARVDKARDKVMELQRERKMN